MTDINDKENRMILSGVTLGLILAASCGIVLSAGLCRESKASFGGMCVAFGTTVAFLMAIFSLFFGVIFRQRENDNGRR